MTHFDTITIRGLVLDVTIGVHQWEQAMAQKLTLNVVLYTDIRAAGTSDDIEQALNYQRVVEAIVGYGQKTRVKLLERFAEGLASTLLEQFGLEKVSIEIIKPHIFSNVNEIAIAIDRAKQGQEAL